jgi:hypothetical protein
MKNLYFIIGTFLLSINGFSQTTEPDQNPNYKVSQEKYAQISDSLNQTQGQTIQNTYTAFDWTEYKAQKKQDRKDARYNRRQMKYQYYRPTTYNNGGYYNGNSNNGYYNNGYNNGYYNSGYNNSPYYGYSNGLYSSLLLGATLYSIFH